VPQVNINTHRSTKNNFRESCFFRPTDGVNRQNFLLLLLLLFMALNSNVRPKNATFGRIATLAASEIYYSFFMALVELVFLLTT
jgi:hypothetical protein